MPDEVQQALTRHAEAVATVRAFAERSGARAWCCSSTARRRADDAHCAPGGGLELTDAGRTFEIPAAAPVDAAPRALPDIRPAPRTTLSIDPETGELEAPLGAVANLARAVLELARAFGGRSVATAEFATRDPELPITIAAREGEPLVLAAGDRRFVLPRASCERSLHLVRRGRRGRRRYRAYERRAAAARCSAGSSTSCRGRSAAPRGSRARRSTTAPDDLLVVRRELGDAHVLLVRSRGEHRVHDGFCGVEHLLEWAKAGGRYR